MHELSIAMQLVEQIVGVAEANQLPRVDEVELQTGVLRRVIPEMMQAAFKEATGNSIADGAVLKITDIPAKARCDQCALEFEPEADNFLCPECQVANVTVLEGNVIILKSVSCQADQS
ncbi:MAG: hydrogenase maturation nickel metallochaperone HypA [Candidatus Omnitrophica bacterium]|nr:hydrogenase maturation nickel metallochaperone HypA [Candidatus Omnitrophota bacterium]MCK5179755.1 hydrogenase maturation nickel metallochaperone HypA [Candidatus Omnitrophota bacterium]